MPNALSSRPRREEARRFIGFILAGGAATILNYTVFFTLLLAGIHYLAASGIGYVSGILVSFSINRRLIFKATGAAAPQLARYVAAYGLALLAQLALLEVLVRTGLTPTIAHGLALITVVIANYFVIKGFVFSKVER